MGFVGYLPSSPLSSPLQKLITPVGPLSITPVGPLITLVDGLGTDVETGER